MNSSFKLLLASASLFSLSACSEHTIKNQLPNAIAGSLVSAISGIPTATNGGVATRPVQAKNPNIGNTHTASSGNGNGMLESAGYTRPNSQSTSKTMSECIDRMPISVVGLSGTCMEKMRLQKKDYISPYEAHKLKKYQKLESDNMQKKYPQSIKRAVIKRPPSTKKKAQNKSIPGVPPAMQGMMSNFISGKNEFNDPDIAQRMSDVYSRKQSINTGSSGASQSSNCQTQAYSTTVGGVHQQGRRTNCN